MIGLTPGAVVDAMELALEPDALPSPVVLSGAPATAARELVRLGDVELGVWEMTPGSAADTETDEVFIVLSGRARIEFQEPALPAVQVGPGSVVRLTAGMRTTWTVTETLRKVYMESNPDCRRRSECPATRNVFDEENL